MKITISKEFKSKSKKTLGAKAPRAADFLYEIMKIVKIIKNYENGQNSEQRKSCCLEKKLFKNFGPQNFSLASV